MNAKLYQYFRSTADFETINIFFISKFPIDFFNPNTSFIRTICSVSSKNLIKFHPPYIFLKIYFFRKNDPKFFDFTPYGMQNKFSIQGRSYLMPKGGINFDHQTKQNRHFRGSNPADHDNNSDDNRLERNSVGTGRRN